MLAQAILAQDIGFRAKLLGGDWGPARSPWPTPGPATLVGRGASSAAPPLPAPTTAVTDGEKLPGAVLPPIDIPLPDMPAPLTEKDFAVAAPAPDKPADSADGKQVGGQGVKA